MDEEVQILINSLSDKKQNNKVFYHLGYVYYLHLFIHGKQLATYWAVVITRNTGGLAEPSQDAIEMKNMRTF